MPEWVRIRQAHDDRKNHRRRADNGSTNKHGLRRRLECIPGAVVFLEMLLGPFELGIEAEVLFDIRSNARNLLDRGQLIHRLRIVGNRPIRVDGNRHRPHAEKSKRNQTKRKDRRRRHHIGARKSVLT